MSIQTVRTPFVNMSYTPDVPSTALSATEYNAGYNVETDVRGMRSVSGDHEILATAPDVPMPAATPATGLPVVTVAAVPAVADATIVVKL